MAKEFDITNLKKSFEALKESFSLLKDIDEKYCQAVEDSCVKRFEFTYEVSKKLMNKYLKLVFDEAGLSINDVFRRMYGLDMLKSFKNWNEFRLYRNNSSHEYDLEKSREIIKIIPKFIEEVEFLIGAFDNDKRLK